MSGYTPWMAGAAEAAKRGYAAQAKRHRAEQRREYDAYRAESRACGYEVEPFEEWLGETTSREAAEDRMGLHREMSLSDACYYGDTY